MMTIIYGTHTFQRTTKKQFYTPKKHNSNEQEKKSQTLRNQQENSASFENFPHFMLKIWRKVVHNLSKLASIIENQSKKSKKLPKISMKKPIFN